MLSISMFVFSKCYGTIIKVELPGN